MRKFLLFVLFVVLVFALVYKSPFSALYNYNKAKSLYDNAQYYQSLPYFERSLFADSKGILARFFYVLALSKSEPKYSVQKRLYEMANSNINDEATKTAKIQINILRGRLLKGFENNYIYNAAYGHDILRWDIRSFPLSVYFDQVDSVPQYYIDLIKDAMDLWSKNTNFIKFKIIDDPKSANIFIMFKNIDLNQCSDGNCKFVVAYTEPSISSNNTLDKITLTFYRTNPKNESFSKDEIYNTAVHELGHTLGIMGHSDNPSDVMYSLQTDDSYWYGYLRGVLSRRDLNTLVLLYRLKPSISNVLNLQSETFYYPPLILGNEDVLLQKKLKELTHYIQSYPELAAGYINISSVYSDIGDFESALKALSSADNFAGNDDEKFLIAYNRAVTYFNMQNFEQSKKYANVAKSIKDLPNVRELISELERVNSR